MEADRCKSGFTLVEVLVAVAIIGMLIALILPAVQSAREAARRIECRSRLSNIGLALHNFEGSHKAFPSAHLGFAAPQGGFEYYSPFAHLLPYFDQSSLYNKINFGVGGSFSVNPQHYGIGDHAIASFLCPSDRGDTGCNFRFCTGSSAYAWDFTDITRRNGAFTRHEVHSSRDFTDGLSYTIGASEKSKSSPLDSGWSSRTDFWYSGLTDLLGYNPPTDIVVRTCASVGTAPLRFGSHAGNSWLLGFYDFTLYNHSVPPNSHIPDCSLLDCGSPVPSNDAEAGVFGARSFHSGGVNCLFMDGSARFVSNTIDLSVWQSLSTRAQGDSVGQF